MSVPDFDLRHPASVTRLPDPNLDDPDDDAKPGTALDELRAELQAELSKGEVTLEVPDRPGWTVTYSADIPLDVLLKRRRRCTNPKTGDLDELKYAAVMLALHCRSIEKGGDPVNFDGRPGTFALPSFQDLVGVPNALAAPDAVAAVHRFYVFDAAILATFGKLLVEAGYAQQVDTVDPTARLSTDS